jgi:hypothetical protein
MLLTEKQKEHSRIPVVIQKSMTLPYIDGLKNDFVAARGVTPEDAHH